MAGDAESLVRLLSDGDDIAPLAALEELLLATAAIIIHGASGDAVLAAEEYGQNLARHVAAEVAADKVSVQ